MIISDHKTFFLLVLALAFLAAVSVFLPQGEFMAGYELPVTKPLLAAVNFFAVLAVYGGIGWLGTTFSSKLGFAKIWDCGVCNRKRFVYPLSAGIGLGIFFILIDFVASLMHDLGPLPHPPFPLSLLASATAAIGEEIIARLFFVSFFVWLILRFCRKSNINLVFWAVAILSAAVFTAMHFPSIFAVYGFSSIAMVPASLLIGLLLMNGSLSLFAAHGLKKYGFWAAAGIHFWADIIWHVLYGAL